MIRSINKSRGDHRLVISGMTWKKQLQNLFDYDEGSIEKLIPFKEEFIAKQTFFNIFRTKETLQVTVEALKKLKMIDGKSIGEKELLCACKVICQNKKIQIKLYQPDQVLKEQDSEDQDSKQEEGHSQAYSECYLVVRSLKNADKEPIGHKLKAKDIIKLGNCEFFIHSIVSKTGQFHYNRKSDQYENQSKFNVKELCHFYISNNQRVYDAGCERLGPQFECKYCLMPSSEQYGQFLCKPCKCSGSCGFVHFNCLVKWNHNKVMKTENKGCTEYKFEQFFCEVCKEEYPQYIKRDNQIFQLLPIQTPKSDYIIIQSFCQTKRHIIVIDELNESEIKFGRGHECEVMIDNPSVSRRHAVIRKLADGEYYLFDQKSKFGTLIRQQAYVLPLVQKDKVTFQSGRTVISFNMRTIHSD